MKDKKILFIANNFDIVIYRFRREVLESFVSQGYSVSLVTPFSNQAVKYCQDNQIEHIFLDIDRRGKSPFKDILLLFKYTKIIKKEKPDYILSYTIKPNLYIGLVNMFFRKKFYPNVTGLGSVFSNNNLLTKVVTTLYKISFKSATKVFFQNSQNEQLFLDKNIVKKNKSILLPGSGVNLNDNECIYYPKDTGDIRFVFLGRIMKEKGIYELIEAFKTLSNKYDNIYLDIYGFCDENNQEFLNKVEQSESIKYHGFTGDTRFVISQSHALILPSYHEGMSNVLIEAAAMSRPVLASNIPGCRETFDDGVSGFRFEHKSVVSLYNSVEKFMELSFEEKRQMGKAGRAKMEKEFNRNIVINKYLEQVKV